MSLDADIQAIVALRERLAGLPGQLILLLQSAAAYHGAVAELVASMDLKRTHAGELTEALEDVLPAAQQAASQGRELLAEGVSAVAASLDGLLQTLDQAQDAVRAEAESVEEQLAGLRGGLQSLTQEVARHRGEAAAAVGRTSLKLLEAHKRLEEAISTAAADAATLVPKVESAAAQSKAATGELCERVEKVGSAAQAHLTDAGRGRLVTLFADHQLKTGEAVEVMGEQCASLLEALPGTMAGSNAALTKATGAFSSSSAAVRSALEPSLRTLCERRPQLAQAFDAHESTRAPLPEAVDAARAAAAQEGEPW